MSQSLQEQLKNLNDYIDTLSPEERRQHELKTYYGSVGGVMSMINAGDTIGVAIAFRSSLSTAMTDEYDMTPLHHAVARDSRLMSAILIEKVNDAPWVRDNFGRLPVDVAQECGHDELSDQLMRITYPDLFLDEQDGPIDQALIAKYHAKYQELGKPDTSPAFAQDLKNRSVLTQLKDESLSGIQDRER